MTRARFRWGWLAAALSTALLLANACGLSPVEDLPPAANTGGSGAGGLGLGPGPSTGGASGPGGGTSGAGGSGVADGGAGGAAGENGGQ